MARKRRLPVADRPLAVLATVEKELGPLPAHLRPRVVDLGPCGDGTAHRWSRLTAETIDNRFSLLSRHCLDCGYYVGSMREAASFSEAV